MGYLRINFTIPGNHKDPDGNPVPKAKLTHRQQWTEKAQEYAAWKRYVQGVFQPHLIAAAIEMPVLKPEQIAKGGRYHKPITRKDNLRMDIKIYFANEHHADPESIYGSIADALFFDDKHLKGSIDFCHAADKKGRTEVSISL